MADKLAAPKRDKHEKREKEEHGKHEHTEKRHKHGKHERKDRSPDSSSDGHRRHKHGKDKDKGRDKRRHVERGIDKDKGRDRDKEKQRRHGTRSPDAVALDDVEEAWPTPAMPPPGGVVLGPSDFFERANEFRVWLLDEQRIYLDELPTDKSRKLFRLFGSLWNSSKLPPKYYAKGGIPETQLSAEQRTRHRWAFAAKLSEADRLQLDSTKDHVDTLTRRSHGDVR